MKDKFRVFETFSGIGAQYKALKEISENIEIVATSE
jgi:site-specific DNA-cytosine methylase